VKKSFSENVSKSDVEEQERRFSSFHSVKTEKRFWGVEISGVEQCQWKNTF